MLSSSPLLPLCFAKMAKQGGDIWVKFYKELIFNHFTQVLSHAKLARKND
jgi:hypothetical protein